MICLLDGLRALEPSATDAAQFLHSEELWWRFLNSFFSIFHSSYYSRKPSPDGTMLVQIWVILSKATRDKRKREGNLYHRWLC